MMYREGAGGRIAIGQPAHAWVCGQMARAWGNARFGAVTPWEEVCLAAEQHDVGMARWDLQPTRNPDTGLPHSFLEMPLEVHLDLWTAGPPRLESQSRYAALLVSMHGRRLYERRDLSQASDTDAEAIRAFIETRRAFEERLLAGLRDDPLTAPHATPEAVARNSQLIWIWDYVSLAVCLDWAPSTAKRVPTAGGETDIELQPIETGLTLDPWPFKAPALSVRCEGRRLTHPDQAFVDAPWETVQLELRPG